MNNTMQMKKILILLWNKCRDHHIVLLKYFIN